MTTDTRGCATSAPTPTDREALAAEVYSRALGYATRRARGSADLAEALRDAATDAVMHALDLFDEGKGPWAPFAMTVVERHVGITMRRWIDKRNRQPDRARLGEGDDHPDHRPGSAHAGIMSPELRDLPPDLRDAVRLYYIDGYSLQDVGLLCDCSHEEIRQRLKRAAEMLRGAPTPHPTRGKGEHRLKR